MNLLIILESFFSFFSQFYDFGQERNHLNHQYISNKGVLIVVLPPRFFSLISTYHTIESFKEKRTFLGGFSCFFFAWKALEQPQKSLSLVLWSHHMKFRRNCHFCSVYKKNAFLNWTNGILSVFYHNFVTNNIQIHISFYHIHMKIVLIGR